MKGINDRTGKTRHEKTVNSQNGVSQPSKRSWLLARGCGGIAQLFASSDRFIIKENIIVVEMFIK